MPQECLIPTENNKFMLSGSYLIYSWSVDGLAQGWRCPNPQAWRNSATRHSFQMTARRRSRTREARSRSPTTSCRVWLVLRSWHRNGVLAGEQFLLRLWTSTCPGLPGESVLAVTAAFAFEGECGMDMKAVRSLLSCRLLDFHSIPH